MPTETTAGSYWIPLKILLKSDVATPIKERSIAMLFEEKQIILKDNTYRSEFHMQKYL